jgi:hypothetical protein
MARDPLRPKPKDTLLSYIKVQERFDRQLYSMLNLAASDIEKDILKLAGKKNIGAVIRRDQLVAVRKQINLRLAKVMRDAGFIIQAGRYEAAALAVETFAAYDAMLLRQVGWTPEMVRAFKDGAMETSRTGISSAIQRMQGASYIPLSEQVYTTRALTSGMVDRYVTSALVRGLNWREFATGVKGMIRPDVPGGVNYAAKRLARTEINNAFHAMQAEKARETPWTTGVLWNLSGSHPTPDECNEYADESHFDGGDPGVYLPEDVPKKPHPQCLCFCTPVTVEPDEFIDQFFAGKYDRYVDKVMRESGFTEDFISAGKS